ncbi:arf-GAP with dual PH domain-containing protein 1-like isoform X2 [Chamaea fasciata]|uniref:arf-GAP with dual PH domain-containing protein 1-like isoform X2 n=1 Tax=Chamaea fasciata TaxID=190680 RepID=UPI003369D79E
MMSPDGTPVTAWQALVHSQLSFISLLATCALFLACPFTRRNAEKPVLWLIAALPSTPMGQVSSSSSLLTHSLSALQPLCPCLCSASSGAPTGLCTLSINLNLRLLLPFSFPSARACFSGGSFFPGLRSALACRCIRCRQLPCWPCLEGHHSEVMAVGNERSMKALKEVWKRTENSLCADCGKPDPDWASSTLGVFICLSCSGIHRNIPSISKVKSLKMDYWDDAQVQFLAKHGNAVTKAIYEAHIPIYYYQPTYNDCQVLREQWIRAKYERKEFTEPGKQLPYSDGVKEGILWKRGRDNGQFLPRKFLLSEREGCLKYFTKQDAKEPKINVKIDVINATFQPEKIGNPNGLQITYLKDNKTRNIFVYHESGKEIVDWFNAIRSVQFHYLKVAFPIASDNEIKNRLTRNFLKEGYMEKTGPKDAFAKGEVFVGSGENGYSVQKGLPSGTQGNFSWHYGITIVTPDRDYLFTCETETDQLDWMRAFTSVINQAMTPQEYAIEAYFKFKS